MPLHLSIFSAHEAPMKTCTATFFTHEHAWSRTPHSLRLFCGPQSNPPRQPILDEIRHRLSVHGYRLPLEAFRVRHVGNVRRGEGRIVVNTEMADPKGVSRPLVCKDQRLVANADAEVDAVGSASRNGNRTVKR